MIELALIIEFTTEQLRTWGIPDTLRAGLGDTYYIIHSELRAGNLGDTPRAGNLGDKLRAGSPGDTPPTALDTHTWEPQTWGIHPELGSGGYTQSSKLETCYLDDTFRGQSWEPGAYTQRSELATRRSRCTGPPELVTWGIVDTLRAQSW